MLEPKEVEIDGVKFILNPLKGFTALYLDKKVITLLTPVIKGFKSLDTNIDLGAAIDGFGTALDGMGEEDYKKFVLSLLSTVQVMAPNKPPIEIDVNTLDSVFAGKALVLYQLMFEIMRYNNFTPFALLGRGGGKIQTTDFLQKLMGKTES